MNEEGGSSAHSFKDDLFLMFASAKQIRRKSRQQIAGLLHLRFIPSPSLCSDVQERAKEAARIGVKNR
jgi:hypothetical protein